MNLFKSLFATAALLTFGIGAASAGTIIVPGTSNPFLAGASIGNSVNNGDTDSFAADAPPSIDVTPGQTFSVLGVTGLVSNGPCCALVGPNGGAGIGSSPFTANGFTALVQSYSNLPINSLIGVFYGPNPADPGVDTVFEIGSGPASFIVPTGATKLFLATVDGYQWNNNEGAFTVSYTLGGVPEPAAWIVMLTGFGMLGFGLRRIGAVATA
ncbi:MAG TPA: PEP-CTERM sorting domain-containing protein [Rhizomicrobium sp.]|nr:PEP-CTERM sorting domain-containing protein [Rhizomicrobium sp.]